MSAPAAISQSSSCDRRIPMGSWSARWYYWVRFYFSPVSSKSAYLCPMSELPQHVIYLSGMLRVPGGSLLGVVLVVPRLATAPSSMQLVKSLSGPAPSSCLRQL
ncbi:hypothetical protein CSUI_004503 [Cystoisospora suis]|uniref:Uncharacterized protein n=1 Tax=Cystoisospora suis TaxID=483139 RepID=A0A2C6L1A8_9APIC|nr:hypothetical protein CSUI_004503 [Cystoisospora suis]